MDGFEFGEKFKLKVSGSSHGPSVELELYGCPAGVEVSVQDIQAELDKRKPGQSILTTSRKEDDLVEVSSGIADGLTTGGAISMLIRNKNTISAHYESIKFKPRPSHADYPARVKYGMDFDLRGGAFFSARMTAAFVMAGAVAKKFLAQKGVKTMAFTKSIGKVNVAREVSDEEILTNVYHNPVNTAAPEAAEAMVAEVEAARRDGDSVGGVVECRVTGLPPGAGDPLFKSIESTIAQAVFAIPAAKGIEFGSGFAGSASRGSANNDEYRLKDGRVVTTSNNSGGILGGLSTGMPIVFRVAFKPTASIFKEQRTVDLSSMTETTLKLEGRHDPCIAIRAVPVVEHVAAFTTADILLRPEERGRN